MSGRKFNTFLFLYSAGWTSRRSYIDWGKEALSSLTLIHPLMIPPMPQLYLWTERLYGEPYSIKTHLHCLRNRRMLTNQPPILLGEERSQIREAPEVGAMPMFGVIITNTASWCVSGVSWVRARPRSSAIASTSWSARPDVKTQLL